MGDESFGVRLKSLMAENQDHICNPRHLATALGLRVTNQVNAWLRDDYAPKLNSPHLRVIREHLRLTEEQQEQLRQAQSRTLEQPRPLRKRKPIVSEPDATLVEPLAGRGRHGATHATATQQPQPTIGKREESLVEKLLDLLEKAPEGTGRDEAANTILLTWQSRDTMLMTDEQRRRWRHALQSVLKRGWQMDYLCRLDGNLRRTVRLIEMILEFIGVGAYRPFYFTDHRTLPAPHDLLVVPGVGAAWLFATTDLHRDDAGMVAREPAKIQAFSAYVRLLKTQTEPLVSAYFSDDDVAYLAELTAAEDHAGDRCIIKSGLSVITFPEEWFDGSMEPPFAPPPHRRLWENRAAHIENRRATIAAFKRHIGRSIYREICAEDAIDLLIERGRYDQDAPFTQLVPDRRLRLRHLQNIVDLLERHDNFQLAIARTRQSRRSSRHAVRNDATWVVAPDNTVFLETWAPGRSSKDVSVNLHITERTVANGFRKYFDQQWNEMRDEERDRDAVKSLLREKIAALEDDITRKGE